MKTFPALAFLTFAVGLLSGSSSWSQEMSMKAEPSEEQIAFFEKKIRPALVKHCYQCHSVEGDKIKGGLVLDTRESSRTGGDTGPAVVPFKLEESLLYTAIQYGDPDLEMPPKHKLEDSLIADFKTWIEMGAPDPREATTGKKTPQHYNSTIDIEKGREHWAYQAPKAAGIPSPKNKDWGRNPIDAFLASAQEAKGLTPAADADPRTLLRRLSFDLTGLPPDSAQVEVFVKAYAANPDSAIAEAVSAYLASAQFGERWGRHWLDVARYAESSGKEINATYPDAWRYRDYVIDSFNADKPLDRFFTEQIAGDLLPASDDATRASNLVATGFLAIGTKNLNEQSSRQFRFDLVDEQIDTTTQALLGTTVSCARCHDHKFDPIPMSDYYAMAGIFLSSDTLYGTANALQSRRASDLLELPSSLPSPEGISLGELLDLELQKTILNDKLTELVAEQREQRQAQRQGEEVQNSIIRILATRSQLGVIEGKLKTYNNDGGRLNLAMGMRDRAEPFDSQVLIRGEEENPTEERIPRGFLQVIKTNDESPIASNESGRLQLAEWITSPENPLTARVFANRVWLWLFGEGLVSSVDNFGKTGEAPSNPELLDYLATRLVALDWSVKDFIREIMSSRAYRLSSDFNAEHFEKDPENRLLWRANKRRIDAESLRDATLAVSAQLDLERPFGSDIAKAGVGFIGRTIPEAGLEKPSTHRSVYLPIVRGVVPESLALFDFADPSLTAGKREITTVPSQALYLMNSDFVIEASERLAAYLINDLGLRGPELAREAFSRCYSRPPTEAESLETQKYIQRFLEAAKTENMSPEQARSLALTTFCQSLISSAEFRYLN
ncbi:MAG: PSD1 domain-containing protein [Verrucomicrobiales bacterium]|nr:PSD1 domain-containing protein [Verrucomicrobiales bacterium]